MKATNQDVEKCVEYSENPELLKEVLAGLEIDITFLRKAKYFDDDKDERNIYEVKLSRPNKNFVKFTFGDSINNTQKGEKPDVYDILASVSSDYNCPDNFDDFCSEFGYDTDSRKAEQTFKRCLEQSKKLRTVFTSEEAEAMPR